MLKFLRYVLAYRRRPQTMKIINVATPADFERVVMNVLARPRRL